MSQSEYSSPQTVSALLIVTTILHVFGLGLTSFRLWFRYHIRRLWWDDFWAVLAFLSDAVCLVVMWLIPAPLDNINIEALPTPALSRTTHIISYWLGFVLYTCSIWSSRLSIVCSVVRIVPPARDVSLAAFGSGGVFLCMWTYMLICKVVSCSMDESWYDAPTVKCTFPEWIAISEVCTDALSDAILVILPLCLLWHVKLPPNQRIMVLSVFSTSILVSVVSAVHTSYLILQDAFIGEITADIGSAIALIVCNLLVIVTFFYRATRNGRDLTAGVFGKNSSGSTDRLTTIDLECPGSSCFTSTVGSETGLTATVTATNISSVVFARAGDIDTFGSVPTTRVLLDTALPLQSIITKQ